MSKKITLYSIEELAEKGWKYSESNAKIYIGSSKFPTMTFNADMAHLLGKEYVYDGVYESRYTRNTKFAQVTDHTGTYNIPQFLIKTKLPKIVVKEISIQGKKASFNGYEYHFSCSLQDLTSKDAEKLAKWVLKVNKEMKA